jgi:hypothetical protein
MTIAAALTASYWQLGINTDRTIIVGEDDGIDSPNTLILKHEEALRAAGGGDAGKDSTTIFNMATYSKAQLPSVPGMFQSLATMPLSK